MVLMGSGRIKPPENFMTLVVLSGSEVVSEVSVNIHDQGDDLKHDELGNVDRKKENDQSDYTTLYDRLQRVEAEGSPGGRAEGTMMHFVEPLVEQGMVHASVNDIKIEIMKQ